MQARGVAEPPPRHTDVAVVVAWTEAALAGFYALLSLLALPGANRRDFAALLTGAVVAGIASLVLGWGATTMSRPAWAATVKRGDPTGWIGLQCLLALVGGFVGGYAGAGVVQTVATVIPHPSDLVTAGVSVVAQIVLYGSLLANLYVFALRPNKTRLADLGWRKPRNIGFVDGWAWLVLGLPLAGVALGAASLALQGLDLVFPYAYNPQCSEVRSSYGQYAVVAAIVVAVMAPIVEETVFRGLAYRYFRRRTAAWAGVALSAVVFAAFHAIPILLIPLALVGVVLAFTYEASDSLFPGMVAHGAFNLVGVVGILSSSSSGC